MAVCKNKDADAENGAVAVDVPGRNGDGGEPDRAEDDDPGDRKLRPESQVPFDLSGRDAFEVVHVSPLSVPWPGRSPFQRSMGRPRAGIDL